MFRMAHLTSLASSLLLLVVVSSTIIQQVPLLSENLDCSDKTLDALAVLRCKVANRLIQVSPIGKPCYPPTSDSQECAMVDGNKTDDMWLSDQAGGYFYYNWASCQATDQTCTLPINHVAAVGSSAICHQGSVPSLAIDLQNVSTLLDDIRAAFEYARTTKRPLVIKNTGHNALGRSSAPASIALWTHHLQAPMVPITLNRTFIPTGCKHGLPETVLHFGPGQQWGGVYTFAEANNLSLVGGSTPSVGVAGWLQGGGHSQLSPVYGMGVDNVRQVKLVTPNGEEVTANECQNSDLFFAIRGGGGGTWGVITNITYKAYPTAFSFVDFNYEFVSLDEGLVREYQHIITSNAVQWINKGWGGYIESGTSHLAQLLNPKTTFADALEDTRPLTDFFRRHNISYNIVPRISMTDYIDKVMSPAVGLWSVNHASRLLPEDVFSGHVQQDLNDVLLKLFHEGLVVCLMLVTPKGFNHTTSSSLHPSWKDAVMIARVSSKWDQYNENILPAAYKHFAKVHDSFADIIRLAPGMGSSLNEADIWEEYHEQNYWGSDNWTRLKEIKSRIDPENILTNWGAVNWDKSDDRYRCYPRP